MTDSVDVADFLRRFRQALSPLPPSEADEIVAEVASHLADRAGMGAAALKREFGDPESYAGQFLAERSLRGALAVGTAWALGQSLLVGVGDSLFGVVVMMPLLVAHVFAGALVLLGVIKALSPAHVGLFLDAGGRFKDLGLLSDVPAGSHEVLGWLGVPLFIGTGIGLLWGCHRSMRFLARWRLGRLAALRQR